MLTTEALQENGLIDHSLREVAIALRNGQLRARDLLDHAIRQRRKLEADLNAYVAWDEGLSMAMAEAADAMLTDADTAPGLLGIPVSIKDVFGLDGYPVKSGSSRALPEKFAREGSFIGGLRTQGAVFTGKTRTDEFAYAGLGTVNDGPVPRNPWGKDCHRAAGGSSSGAPVSLWQETALVAVASDTSGSVRRPAGLTGTAGLKLTIGRWPTDDMIPLSPTMDTPGILTRTVEDLRFAFYAIDPMTRNRNRAWQAPDVDPGTITMAICGDHMWDDCDPGVAEAVQAGIGDLEKAGVKLVKLDLPEVSDAYRTVLNGGVVSSEFMAFFDEELPEWAGVLQPQLKTRLAGPDRPNLSAVTYLKNLNEMRRCAVAVAEKLKDVDVLVGPTLPITAPALEDIQTAEAWQESNKRAVRNTYIASLLGLCGLSMPAGLDACQMPVGMQVMAKPWDEERLLDISCTFERIIGNGQDRLGHPPLIA